MDTAPIGTKSGDISFLLNDGAENLSDFRSMGVATMVGIKHGMFVLTHQFEPDGGIPGEPRRLPGRLGLACDLHRKRHEKQDVGDCGRDQQALLEGLVSARVADGFGQDHGAD